MQYTYYLIYEAVIHYNGTGMIQVRLIFGSNVPVKGALVRIVIYLLFHGAPYNLATGSKRTL